MLEELPVFRLLDRLQLRADQFDVVLVENPALGEGNRGIQRSLAPHSGQEGVRAFPFDDFFDEVGSDRLDVGPVGKFRIRHDRGGITVDENDAKTFLLEDPACLRAGIIELAGLADDDRPRADNED